MIKYALATVVALVFAFTASAQHNHNGHNHNNNGNNGNGNHHRHHHHHRFGHNHGFGHHHVVRHHYNFQFRHVPTVALYGSFAQYQQFGYAVVGYSDFAAVQGHCGQFGFQIVQVNPVQNFVVVRLPVNYGWNTIQRFSGFHGVRFIEPGFRRY